MHFNVQQVDLKLDSHCSRRPAVVHLPTIVTLVEVEA